MNSYRFKNPRPKESATEYNEFKYEYGERTFLKTPADISQPGFFDVLNERQSNKDFDHVAPDQLATLLWYCGKTLIRETINEARTWEHRVPPSAGGLHPVDLIILEGETRSLQYYNPLEHSLYELESLSKDDINDFWEHINEVVQIQMGTAIWCVGQPLKVEAIYKNGQSLLWRDAGILIGTLAYVTQALGLNCCPVGVLGEPYVQKMFNDDVVGLGGCVVGA